MTDYVLADPSSNLNFQHDWTEWLAVGETITARLWSISPFNEGTPVTPALTGATTDTVFVTGMLQGRIYRLTERITTSAGVIDERTIVIRCEET
jgi:hypothetical protein